MGEEGKDCGEARRAGKMRRVGSQGTVGRVGSQGTVGRVERAGNVEENIILIVISHVLSPDLEQIHFGSEEIWKPDILLYNSAESGKVRAQPLLKPVRYPLPA
jgi:hypothetical protein